MGRDIDLPSPIFLRREVTFHATKRNTTDFNEKEGKEQLLRLSVRFSVDFRLAVFLCISPNLFRLL